MKEDVQIKLLAYQKGTPHRKIKKLMKEMEEAWEETHPGGKMICLPVEVKFEEWARQTERLTKT